MEFKKLSGENFKVIYPEGMYGEANRLINTLETIYEPTSRSLGVKPDPTSIVLHNRTTVANGFVTLGPRRSEFFTTSAQNYNFVGVNDWLDLLAVHEFRHIVQYDKARTGFSNAFYYVFGENGLAAIAGVAVPQWFWEGDAVAVETALTPGGRGRIPNFDLLYRTNLLTRGPWDFNKEYLGSFKHAVPDHYVTGYLLTTHVRREHGIGVWDKVLEKTYKFPFTPYRFSSKLKQVTGKYIRGQYQDMNNELEDLWRKQIDGIETDPAEFLALPVRPEFTNYLYPQQLDNGMVVAMRTGLDYPSQLVEITEMRRVKKLKTTGPFNDGGMMSSGGNKVVWTEFRYHPRWRRKNYSVVMVYDAETGELTQLTKKSRYVASAISPDGDQIASVHADLENNYSLHLLDAGTGELIREISYEGNAFISMPRWSADGEYIVTLRKAEWGKEVVAFNATTGQERILIGPTMENIGYPVLTDDYLYYNSPLSGIDNIYAKDLGTGQTYQVTHRRFGGYNPAITDNGRSLIFNDFTKDGMAIARMGLTPADWTPLNEATDRTIGYYQPVVEGEANPDLLREVPEKEYKPENYSRAANMFKVHSWGPLFTTTQSDLEIGVFSQDLLSTTELAAGYGYDAQEQTGRWFGRVSYQQWFPVLDLEVYTADRSRNITIDDVSRSLTWDEKGLQFGLRVPLLLTKGKYLQSLSLSSNFVYNHISEYSDTVREFSQQSDGNLLALEHRVSWGHFLRSSVRDLYAPWGQQLSLTYRHDAFGSEFSGQLASAQGWLYFPGLLPHHHFWVRGGYQWQEVDTYQWRNTLFYPRGYGSSSWKTFRTVAFNYALPVWYPDIAIGPVINFQRVKLNMFYDRGWGNDLFFSAGVVGLPSDISDNINSLSYRSFGAEITFDVNLFRTQPLFEFGARYSVTKNLLSSGDQGSIELLIGSFSF
ncbi:hypothetical protein AB9P05_18130 [Roseivirga sp. BDSF3-8]|uniref:hypothetical protein n=1 Tax=Roseivirga sp. BDSF3-8 TaxID=3241598 RepID=UPI0035318A7C